MQSSFDNYPLAPQQQSHREDGKRRTTGQKPNHHPVISGSFHYISDALKNKRSEERFAESYQSGNSSHLSRQHVLLKGMLVGQAGSEPKNENRKDQYVQPRIAYDEQ